MITLCRHKIPYDFLILSSAILSYIWLSYHHCLVTFCLCVPVIIGISCTIAIIKYNNILFKMDVPCVKCWSKTKEETNVSEMFGSFKRKSNLFYVPICFDNWYMSTLLHVSNKQQLQYCMKANVPVSCIYLEMW